MPEIKKPCPKCGKVGHRAKIDNGSTWLYKYFLCRHQCTEPKIDLKTQIARDGNLLIKCHSCGYVKPVYKEEE